MLQKPTYLQAPLKSEVPTWAIIPRVIWPTEWLTKFRRVACPLLRALYGHQTSGDGWFEFFDETLVTKMRGSRLEEFPSLWYFKELEVLIAAYVDDVIAAGPVANVDRFWKEVQKYIKFDEIAPPGRYLGRDHLIFEFTGGKTIFMSMHDYALSAVDMYEVKYGPVREYETPFVSDAALTEEGYTDLGHLAGDAASLLMKLLWLARLSRPDLSFAIVHLAGSITRWCRNHDLQLKRIVGYAKKTANLGLWGSVSFASPLPTIKFYCDSDLAGDVQTCKSHSGIFVALASDDGLLFPVSWTSKRQSAVSRSTTEAELASANEGVFQDGIPIKSILELILKAEVSAELLEDNTACICVLRSGYSAKLRSMPRTHRISVAALSEALMQRLFRITHVETNLQLADILTKSLNKTTFLRLRNMIGVDAPPDLPT